MKKCTERLVPWFVLVLSVFVTFFVISDLEALELGHINTMSPRAQALDSAQFGTGDMGLPPVPTPATLEEALHSFAFLSGVGGVAFAAVASPVEPMSIRTLRYDHNAPDGKRLKIILSETLRGPGCAAPRSTVVAPVYDWQWIPLARFADSPSFKCFTLFGHLEDSAEEKRHLEGGHRIVSYHSAFSHSLMGLRLMQADILLLYPDSSHLPSEGGKEILGAGEPPFNLAENDRALSALQTAVRRLPGGPFQSYVICDHKVDVKFSLSGGRLALTGEPYWYCWRNKARNDADLVRINTQANRKADDRLQEELRNAQRQLSAGEFQAKYSAAQVDARFSKLFDEEASKSMLAEMKGYSDALTAMVRQAEGGNAHVYRALVKAMRYAAFFRHVRQTRPEAFKSLLESVRVKRTDPQVTTPSILVLPPTYR